MLRDAEQKPTWRDGSLHLAGAFIAGRSGPCYHKEAEMESTSQSLYVFVLFMSVLLAALLGGLYTSLLIAFGRRLARQAFARLLKVGAWLALGGFGVALLGSMLHPLSA